MIFDFRVSVFARRAVRALLKDTHYKEHKHLLYSDFTVYEDETSDIHEKLIQLSKEIKQ
jgi:hypothetical protein